MTGSSWLKRLLSVFGSGQESSTWHDRLPEEGVSPSDRFLIEALPFERPAVAGKDALAEWTRRRKTGGMYPVIVGDEEALIRLAEQWGMEDRSPAEILAAAGSLAHPGSIFDLRKGETESVRMFFAERGEKIQDDYGAPTGDWPDPDEIGANVGPTIAWQPGTSEPLEKAYLLLIPTEKGEEVPAFLRWGGWNDCPPPEYHAAALRRWSDRYGAELVAINGDTMELRVARRPTSREEALELAREQYAYCPDIVEQGVEQIAALAAVLMESDWWYFWWD